MVYITYLRIRDIFDDSTTDFVYLSYFCMFNHICTNMIYNIHVYIPKIDRSFPTHLAKTVEPLPWPPTEWARPPATFHRQPFAVSWHEAVNLPFLCDVGADKNTQWCSMKKTQQIQQDTWTLLEMILYEDVLWPADISFSRPSISNHRGISFILLNFAVKRTMYFQ